ncbi:hypothetical protein R70211_05373 [Paraburkholderia domus]|uniref:Uncharacterized protein n=1 Tax=Paraburkholderia domus TaxID=2793075 RepID=A0A9N8N1H7_9BURK|nr:hypothetical protein R70211_05373 [Paraburkholderia domus]
MCNGVQHAKRFNGQIRPLMVRSSHLTDAQVRAKKNSDQSTGIMRISGWKIFLWSRQGELVRLGVAYRCSFAQSPCALRAVWMHLTTVVFAACIHFTPTRVLAGESAYAASVEVWSAITATSMNAGAGIAASLEAVDRRDTRFSSLPVSAIGLPGNSGLVEIPPLPASTLLAAETPNGRVAQVIPVQVASIGVTCRSVITGPPENFHHTVHMTISNPNDCGACGASVIAASMRVTDQI